MKVTINIPDNDLVFIDVPEIYNNFKIVNYGYAGTYIMETDSNGLNHWKMKLDNGNYEIIGFIKDVSTDIVRTPIDKNFILRRR